MLGASVQREGAPSGIIRARDGELEQDGAMAGQGERSEQGELVDTVEAESVGGDESELEESGTGEHDMPEDLVSREPGLVEQGEPTGEEEAVAVGERDGGAEQGMLGGAEAEGREVGVLGRAGIEPEALAPEGVGWQRDGLGLPGRKEGIPVDIKALEMESRESRGEREEV
jgi:hypothetical protein